MSKAGITTSLVKKMNRKIIFNYIYENKNVSKQEIARDLEMSLTTVSQNLKELSEKDLIAKDGFYQSTGGRKAYVIRIHSTSRTAIGASIFKDKIFLTAIDLYGNPLFREVIRLPYQNTQEYCRAFGEAVNRFIEQLKGNRILGVGIAIQGIVSGDGSHVSYGAIMQNTGFQLESLSRFIPYPCRLEHDSKAAAYVELWNKSDMEDSLVILLNQNMGSALIINGQIHSGLHMHSGTLEHMCVAPDGFPCYCGQRGCLETYCSAESLEKSAGCNVREFFLALRGGDIMMREIWNSYLMHLAFALKNINTILDCHIIISGYLATFFNENDIQQLFQNICSLSSFPIPQNFITKQEEGEFSTAIGAGLYYIHQFIEQI